jgi:hypothetical protein
LLSDPEVEITVVGARDGNVITRHGFLCGQPQGGTEMMKAASTICMALMAGSAFADAKCAKHPKSEWLPQAEAKAKIEAQGYKIKKFKVDGNCYEIYGTNKEGKRAEVYFDTKTLDVVKAEIGK